MSFGRIWKLVLAAVLLLLALVFVPPMVSAKRFERRIAASMSQSLGRPVQLNGISFHLLPVPAFTLNNFVVDEDPRFGYEPTIRAESVTAELRLSSLWRRQVEISTLRLEAPSVNLVRNPAGRWNVEDLLLQAAHAHPAPTGQPRHGPAPRFPYIEASGGRLNLKLGDQKLAFSLTDADLALWLSSDPDEWRLRLKALPTRTDANVQNAGAIRMEGSLGRGSSPSQLPIHLQIGWTEAPLGEASRLVTADDMGWRGTLTAEAQLNGTVGDARLQSRLQLHDVRRNEFVPVETGELDLHCAAAAVVHHLELQDLVCRQMVDDAPALSLRAPRLDLQMPRRTSLTAQMQRLPLPWILRWAGTLSHRIDPRRTAAGALSGEITVDGASDPAAWSGDLSLEVPSLVPPVPGDAPSTGQLTLPLHLTSADNHGPLLQLPEATLRTGANTTLALAAELSPEGGQISASGSILPAQLARLGHMLPELTDGLQPLLPAPDASAKPTPIHLDATCRRVWLQPQTCTAGSHLR